MFTHTIKNNGGIYELMRNGDRTYCINSISIESCKECDSLCPMFDLQKVDARYCGTKHSKYYLNLRCSPQKVEFWFDSIDENGKEI